jgi:hypothetical protein
MKKTILILCCFGIYASVKSQNLVLNGSLEDNAASGNTYLMSNSWEATIPHSWHIDAGTQDLLMSDSCGGAADGLWFAHTNSNGFAPYSSFCFELSQNLIIGHQYKVTYSYRVCHGPGCNIAISISDTTLYPGNDNVNSNTLVSSTTWSTYMYTFTSTSTGKYLAVSANNQLHNEVELDNFILEDLSVGINEVDEDFVSLYPNPIAEKLFYTFNKGSGQISQIKIFNNCGALVYSGRLERSQSFIDVSKFNSGIYFVLVESADRIFTRRIIIE